MKKYIIGILVVSTLVLYSFYIRHEQPNIAAPQNSSATINHSSNPTTSGSGTPPLDTTGTQGNSNSSSSNPANNSAQSGGSTYRDGTYKGSTEDAYYGNVQVEATVSGGKITGVKFLKSPTTHSTSVYINNQAMPYLQQEAIQSQSSDVNIVSGATYTSQAFIQSLSNALSQAS